MPRWRLKGGEEGELTMALPICHRVIVQVDGDLMGGKIILRGGLAPGDALIIDAVREGFAEVLPVRFIAPSFDGPEEATVTITIAGIE
jgi:hypothetical protein